MSKKADLSQRPYVTTDPTDSAKVSRRQNLKSLFTTVVFLCVLAILVFFSHSLIKKQNLISPLHSDDDLVNQPELVGFDQLTQNQLLLEKMANKNLSRQKVIYGFLPYWNISSDLQLHSALTDLNYFRLLVGENGYLIKENNAEASEIGWQRLNNETWQNLANNWQQGSPNPYDRRLALTVFLDDSTVLSKVLNDESLRDNLVSDLNIFLSQNQQFSEINLDFEYFGVSDENLRLGMNDLLAKLRLLIATNHPKVRLTIDVFGKSAERSSGLYDWQAVKEYVDYVILMAYDYKTRSSSQPGPVAPTLGAAVWGGNDVMTSLNLLLQKIPPYQVLLGIPFYGYQWQVTSLDIHEARTYPETGETVSYRRVRDLLAKAQENSITTSWDGDSLTPYLSYTKEDNTKYLLFYEDDRSLQYKLDLVKDMNLGGIAIWALGYEGQTEELWNVIDKFKKQ